MKITKRQLRRIIKEEKRKLVNEERARLGFDLDKNLEQQLRELAQYFSRSYLDHGQALIEMTKILQDELAQEESDRNW